MSLEEEGFREAELAPDALGPRFLFDALGPGATENTTPG